MSPQIKEISPELVRQIADEIDAEGVEPAGIAEPTYNNGMSDSVREILSDKEKLRAQINDTFAVLA